MSKPGRAGLPLRAQILGLVLLASAAHAQFTVLPPFEHRSIYSPLAAEPRAAQTKVSFPARASSFPYAVNPGQSAVWDISVGDEIPILTFSSSNAIANGDGAPANGWAAAVAFPLSFHMVEDMGKDESNPILNTDYRFGLMLKFQYGFADGWGMTKPKIGLRFVPIAHESTHLGDEFTLHATQKYGNSFQRVNVSYEYQDIGVSFEPGLLKDGRLQAKFRGGLIYLIRNRDKGWYSPELIQPIGGTVTPSKRNIEPYFGFEANYTDWPWPDWGLVFSMDIRNRTVYGYNRPSSNVDEATQLSYNTLIGLKNDRGLGKLKPAYYLRYYHGVNPAGQFRSQMNYQQYGVEIQFNF